MSASWPDPPLLESLGVALDELPLEVTARRRDARRCRLTPLILGLLMAGCIPFHHALVDGRDYRIDHPARIIYARSVAVARQLCLDRQAVAPHRTWLLPASAVDAGCWDSRDDVIVLTEGTRPGDILWTHEMAHRRCQCDFHR